MTPQSLSLSGALAALCLLWTGTALAALEVKSLKPPTPVSQYKPYTESSQGLERSEFSYEGHLRRYYLYVPQQTSSQEALPLVIVLHGSNRTGASLVERWKGVARRHNLLVAGPDALGRSRWDGDDDGIEFLKEMARQIHVKQPVDGTRIYVFGHSAGGYFVTQLLASNDAPFAAAGIHAGALAGSATMMRGLASFADERPLIILSGTDDVTVPIQDVREAAELFAKSGFPVKLYVLEGYNHWYYTLAPYINQKVWRFFSRYALAHPWDLNRD